MHKIKRLTQQAYLPANSDRREATLSRKRKEYEDYVEQTFGNGIDSLDQGLIHQIHIDIQRTNAHIPLYQSGVTQQVCFLKSFNGETIPGGLKDLYVFTILLFFTAIRDYFDRKHFTLTMPI